MIKQVDKIVAEVGSGATVPLIGLIDDEYVIIKTFKNLWGNKILVNEFISLKIAQILDLPIPNGGLCLINSNTDIEDLYLSEITLESIEGIGFYSRRVEKSIEVVDLDKDDLNIINNLYDISKIIVFDHLIYNKDRHDGNMLLDISGSGNIYIIDHSHIFNLGHNWNKIKLEQLILSQDYKDKIIMNENQDVYELFIDKENINTYIEHINNFKQLMKIRLSEDVFRSIIDEVPSEWIKPEDKEGVLNYLMYRLNNIDTICESIINYLNNPGGEFNENPILNFEL